MISLAGIEKQESSLSTWFSILPRIENRVSTYFWTILYNRFIIPLRKIFCLGSLCYCDDSVDCNICPAYQIFWNPVPMLLSKQNLSKNKTSFWSHWCFLTIFSSNETVCFGQCIDKKLDHLNFIPLKEKFSLHPSTKMGIGGGTQKNQSWEHHVTMTVSGNYPGTITLLTKGT